MKVGVWENSSPRDTRQEFNESGSSLINKVDSTTVGSHATHVTGTIAAFGVNSAAKGMAYTVHYIVCCGKCSYPNVESR